MAGMAQLPTSTKPCWRKWALKQLRRSGTPFESCAYNVHVYSLHGVNDSLIYIFGISRLLRLLLNSTPWFWKFSRILSAFTKNANSNRLFGLQNKHMALSSLLGEWELAFRAKDTWKCWLDSRQSHAPHQHAPYQDVENWAGDSLIFASQYLSDPVCLYASFTGVLEFLWPYLATLFEAIRHIIHQFYGTTVDIFQTLLLLRPSWCC